MTHDAKLTTGCRRHARPQGLHAGALPRRRQPAFQPLKPDNMDIDEIIAGGGLVFRKAPRQDNDNGKIKTKAKKKQYITGAHCSGSARQKAKYRQQRANRRKGK